MNFGIEEDKHKYSNNTNIELNDNLKKEDFPLIKDSYENNVDYDIKILSLDFYHYNNNFFTKLNNFKEKINIEVYKDLDLQDMNKIILDGLFIFVNNCHFSKIKPLNS